MIVDFFIGIWEAIATWFFSLVPRINEVDGVIVTGANYLSSLIVGAHTLSAWVPWELMGILVVLSASLWGAMMFFKLVRVVLGHFPLIGGNG